MFSGQLHREDSWEAGCNKKRSCCKDAFHLSKVCSHGCFSSSRCLLYPRFDRLFSDNLQTLQCILLTCIMVLSRSLGLRPPFTEAPNDPTYVVAGSDARLKWNYSHGSVSRVDMQYHKSGRWVTILSKDNAGTVSINPALPASLKSRIRIEGNATLVILTVNTRDSTRYKCVFVPTSGPATEEDPIQLVAIGTGCTVLKRDCVNLYCSHKNHMIHNDSLNSADIYTRIIRVYMQKLI